MNSFSLPHWVPRHRHQGQSKLNMRYMPTIHGAESHEKRPMYSRKRAHIIMLIWSIVIRRVLRFREHIDCRFLCETKVADRCRAVFERARGAEVACVHPRVVLFVRADHLHHRPNQLIRQKQNHWPTSPALGVLLNPVQHVCPGEWKHAPKTAKRRPLVTCFG